MLRLFRRIRRSNLSDYAIVIIESKMSIIDRLVQSNVIYILAFSWARTDRDVNFPKWFRFKLATHPTILRLSPNFKWFNKTSSRLVHWFLNFLFNAFSKYFLGLTLKLTCELFILRRFFNGKYKPTYDESKLNAHFKFFVYSQNFFEI